MKLTAHASSSRGNLYELHDGKTRILIECGLSPKKMISTLSCPIGSYAGVLISHEHMDHARAAAYLVTLGVPVYMTQGTFEALCDVPNLPNLHDMRDMVPFALGTLDVLPMRTYHDATEPVGFLIHSRADDTSVFFATDTGYLYHPVSGVDIVAVECNYSDALLNASSRISQKTIERIRRNHMGFERTRDYLDACDLAKTREIWLLHLSDAHSHAEQFRKLILDRYGIPVHIA